MTTGVFIHPLVDLDSAVRGLLEWLPVPLVAWSPEGEILLWNTGATRLTGYDWRELRDKPWMEVLCPEERDRSIIAEATQGILEGRQSIEEGLWFVIQRKDGARRTVLAQIIPLLDASRTPVAVCALLEDATAREEPFLASLGVRRHRVTVDEELDTLVLRVDAKTGELTHVNAAASALLGYSEAQLIEDQRLLPSRILPEYDEPLETAMADAVRGAPRSLEIGLLNRDGEERYLSAVLYPIRNPKGQVVTVEIVARDITARKRTEAALAESHLRLKAAYQTLRAQHEQLRSIDRLKNQIIANVSHELRTPLVVIGGYNELMLQGALGELTEQQRRGLEVSARSIKRLLGLIENLLEYARLVRDGLRLPEEQVVLNDLLREVVDSFEQEADAKSLVIETDIPEEHLLVRADSKRLRQAFANILDNAIKFSQKGGRVFVRLMPVGAEACVEIADEGIGIPESEQSRIFDSFYQVDGSSTRAYSGTGIGLAVAKEIVERHGGRIRVRSSPGAGSSFLVFLPSAAEGEVPLGPRQASGRGGQAVEEGEGA